MEKRKNQELISPDLLIHPGETILEVINDRGITQKELAIRTGFSEKHISTVINGKKSISADLAKKLEYALDIPASFWRNLQTNYDLELVVFNEPHNISQKEVDIAKEVKDAVKVFTNESIGKNNSDKVYYLRQRLGVSNLESIKNLNPSIYRAQFEKGTSENIMYAWQYLCEKEVENQTENPLDIEKLKNNINEIKGVMFDENGLHVEKIKELLNDAGVLFTVKKHVKGAPINGLTVKTKRNQVMIAMTIRGAYVDIFWFSLFHEIAHVLNEDFNKDQSKWESNSPLENKANKLAQDILINPDNYKLFLEKGDFSRKAIDRFASSEGVLSTIVIGRLMNDELIPWNSLDHRRDKYKWSH